MQKVGETNDRFIRRNSFQIQSITAIRFSDYNSNVVITKDEGMINIYYLNGRLERWHFVYFFHGCCLPRVDDAGSIEQGNYDCN